MASVTLWPSVSRSIHELGLTYRPLEETLLDHYDSRRARRRRG
ncbi:hypothetical protein ACWC2T_12875 [Streptomyces sp. NPDC001393]